jgi:transposase
VARSRVELFEAIRRDHRRDELSIRALADKHGVHRRTVRQALESAVPPERKTPARAAPKLDPAKALIDAMLTEDLTAPRKQRHTARRVLARLVEEHQLTDLTYSAVRDYVAKRRPEIWAAAGKALEEAFVPQTHEPGAEAEVDFADLWIDLAGVRTKCFLFTLRLSFSGKAVHRVYSTQGQEAFLEGHQQAFEVFGGTPVFHIRYDNLKSAVSRVLFGRTRTESARWVTFRSHYGFDSFYCHPGVEGAHEKGGVEGEGGRFRRNHLVPVPTVESMAELNELLKAYDLADDTRRIGNRTLSVAEHFTFERDLLRPLPDEAFETGLLLTPRVDRYARVIVRQCHYSVPAHLIGHRIRAVLRASELVVFDGRRQAARHERATVRGSETLVLDHYLEVLVRKPGALRGATALVQARAAGTFTSAHEAFWAAARTAHGDSGGTRALVQVLLLHRHHAHADVVAGITAALRVGAVSPDVVAVETRKHQQQQANPAGEGQVVVSLDQRRLAELTDQLPTDSRPPPTVDVYDSLLTGTRDP